MKTLKITQGNDFVIYLPLVLLNTSGKEPVDTSDMASVVVKVKRACADAITVTPTYVQNFMVLSFPETMALGSYDADIKFKLDGVDKSVQINKFFEIVEYDYQSNWQDYIVGDHIVTDTQAYIAGAHYTDAEYTALKAQLTAKIAEVEAVKAEWLAKVAELTGLAKEANATQNKQAILDAIANIDLSTVAKQGSNTAATNTAILTAIGAIVTGASIEDINASLATLKASLTGTNTSADLTAILTAIAAIPTSQITGYALQGSNANATNTAIYTLLADLPELQSLYSARAEANQDGADTYTIVFPYTAQVVTQGDNITITV